MFFFFETQGLNSTATKILHKAFSSPLEIDNVVYVLILSRVRLIPQYTHAMGDIVNWMD